MEVSRSGAGSCRRRSRGKAADSGAVTRRAWGWRPPVHCRSGCTLGGGRAAGDLDRDAPRQGAQKTDDREPTGTMSWMAQQLTRMAWFRPVHAKAPMAQETRDLLTARCGMSRAAAEAARWVKGWPASVRISDGHELAPAVVVHLARSA
jgi:hypothetical protein